MFSPSEYAMRWCSIDMQIDFVTRHRNPQPPPNHLPAPMLAMGAKWMCGDFEWIYHSHSDSVRCASVTPTVPTYTHFYIYIRRVCVCVAKAISPLYMKIIMHTPSDRFISLSLFLSIYVEYTQRFAASHRGGVTRFPTVFHSSHPLASAFPNNHQPPPPTPVCVAEPWNWKMYTYIYRFLYSDEVKGILIYFTHEVLSLSNLDMKLIFPAQPSKLQPDDVRRVYLKIIQRI